jgi:YebC/PmpR family DNA-binding regulatory protein
MSGHSKWSSIKHKKAATDAKRGRLFTRIMKEITVAARLGGGDPDGNPRLRTVLLAARGANMPKDNTEKAIKKGTGELPGVSYEEIFYEGYGPGGVAIYIHAVTDNRNRTLPEIRRLFSKYGGNLGETHCVSWMFENKGYLVVPKEAAREETLLEVVLEAGGDDVRDDGGNWEIFTPPERLEGVKESLNAKSIETTTAELSMIPKTSVKLEGKKAKQLLSMMEALEEHDDVQNVWANFDIDEAEITEERAAS